MASIDRQTGRLLPVNSEVKHERQWQYRHVVHAAAAQLSYGVFALWQDTKPSFFAEGKAFPAV